MCHDYDCIAAWYPDADDATPPVLPSCADARPLLGRVVAISVAFEPLAVSITGVLFFAYGISTLELGGYVVAAAGTAVLALSYRSSGSERDLVHAE